MLKRNYWQNKLKTISNSLVKRKEFKKDSFNINAEIEFNIMSGFFIIRKLNESKKLTNKFLSTNIKGHKYPFIVGNNITPFNDHKWPEFYDFKDKKKAKFDIPFLCNLFIHSFYFIPSEVFVEESINDKIEIATDEEYYALCKIHKRKYQGLLFNSDGTKEDFLYELDIDQIIKIFQEVSIMDITKSSITYDKNRDKYIYLQSDNKQEISQEVKELIAANEKL